MVLEHHFLWELQITNTETWLMSTKKTLIFGVMFDVAPHLVFFSLQLIGIGHSVILKTLHYCSFYHWFNCCLHSSYCCWCWQIVQEKRYALRLLENPTIFSLIKLKNSNLGLGEYNLIVIHYPLFPTSFCCHWNSSWWSSRAIVFLNVMQVSFSLPVTQVHYFKNNLLVHSLWAFQRWKHLYIK